MNPNKLFYVDKYRKDEWEEKYREKHSGIPNGFVECDGRRLDKTKFPELFEIIKDSYEKTVNADPKTFCLPDLRGSIPGPPGRTKTYYHQSFMIKTTHKYDDPDFSTLPIGYVAPAPTTREK